MLQRTTLQGRAALESHRRSRSLCGFIVASCGRIVSTRSAPRRSSGCWPMSRKNYRAGSRPKACRSPSSLSSRGEG